ncbi:MAG: DnaD domain protein [Lachnospiraceae bacterium]
MDTLTIQRSDLADVTAVANTFIDEYMPSANGEYVKIYLYFLRCLSQQAEPLSLEAVAGKLDHTTNYIMKALFYWQENGILSLSTDSGQNVTGIHFLPIARPADKSEARHERETAAQPSSSVCEPSKKQPHIPEKRTYTLEEKQQLTQDEDFKNACFVTQSYFGRPLGPTQLEHLMYIYDQLGFDLELIDYLVEYCASRGKKSMRYVEATAIGWVQQGITNVTMAKQTVSLYSRLSASVMQQFGISNRSLVPEERAYLEKWLNVYHMPEALIVEACRRTVRATKKGSFEYADSILNSWYKNQIRSMDQVEKADLAHQKARPAAKNSPSRTAKQTSFPQRNYDMDSLEKQLLNTD